MGVRAGHFFRLRRVIGYLYGISENKQVIHFFHCSVSFWHQYMFILFAHYVVAPGDRQLSTMLSVCSTVEHLFLYMTKCTSNLFLYKNNLKSIVLLAIKHLCTVTVGLDGQCVQHYWSKTICELSLPALRVKEIITVSFWCKVLSHNYIFLLKHTAWNEESWECVYSWHRDPALQCMVDTT